ncbi:hypothetical protein GMOD_00002101 [Pyrenophora seminiperda CCB06]|uniref:Uncharacterized protein n=1 Tax=Pyrenophora seminiperda CCB06 TaxID=1302712 RepID=A0A3M7LWX2_9PLEO|nr:hypothetical protein GMOD_00002101 [Pyrenophora seminiperda CCB06]
MLSYDERIVDMITVPLFPYPAFAQLPSRYESPPSLVMSVKDFSLRSTSSVDLCIAHLVLSSHNCGLSSYLLFHSQCATAWLSFPSQLRTPTFAASPKCCAGRTWHLYNSEFDSLTVHYIHLQTQSLFRSALFAETSASHSRCLPTPHHTTMYILL